MPPTSVGKRSIWSRTTASVTTMSWFSGSAPVGGGPPSHARERVPGQIEPLQLPGPKFRPVPSALGLAGCGTDFVGTLTRSWRLVMLHPFREGRVCLVFPVRVPCDLPLTQGPSWRPCAAHSEGPVPRPGATRHAGALRNQPDGRSHSGPLCPAALYQPVKVRGPRAHRGKIRDIAIARTMPDKCKQKRRFSA